MKAPIDAAGRVVIPKTIREELALEAGSELLISVRDGSLVLTPRPTPVALVRRGKVLVAKTTEAMPTLSDREVREALEGSRR
jgi:AbrB family looped-hinge helix DNA binding protein